ncbi:hypothetical protein ACVIYL_008947 [Bradyrhizobium sp. USDA 3315]
MLGFARPDKPTDNAFIEALSPGPGSIAAHQALSYSSFASGHLWEGGAAFVE